jgi:hypothetical protein
MTPYAGSEEARPTDRMPFLRLDEAGQVIAELRRWGFIMSGKPTGAKPEFQSETRQRICWLIYSPLAFYPLDQSK